MAKAKKKRDTHTLTFRRCKKGFEAEIHSANGELIVRSPNQGYEREATCRRIMASLFKAIRNGTIGIPVKAEKEK